MLSSSIGLALWMWANYLQNDFCYEQFYIIYTTEILNWPIVPIVVAFEGILFYNICLISISVFQAKQALHVDGAPTLDSHCNNLFLRLKESPRLSQSWRYRHFSFFTPDVIWRHMHPPSWISLFCHKPEKITWIDEQFDQNVIECKEKYFVDTGKEN